jgi:hypothetical protein
MKGLQVLGKLPQSYDDVGLFRKLLRTFGDVRNVRSDENDPTSTELAKLYSLSVKHEDLDVAIKDKVLQPIWQEGVVYSNGVEKEKWMTSSYHLRLLAMQYDVKFVLYSIKYYTDAADAVTTLKVGDNGGNTWEQGLHQLKDEEKPDTIQLVHDHLAGHYMYVAYRG